MQEAKEKSKTSYTEIAFADVMRAVIDSFKYLLSKWWVFLIVGAIGAGAGILKAWLEKPKYESHLTFALEEGEGGLGGALSLAAEFGFSIGGGSNIFEGDNILSLLTSRRIVERVLLSTDTVNGKAITMADYLKVVSNDSTKKNEGEKLSDKELRLSQVSFPVGQPRNTFSYLQDSVLINMYKDFTEGGGLRANRPDKKINLYEISVVSPNERFSKVFTDKLIKEATEFYVELKTKRSRETLDILEKRVAETKGSLNSAIVSRAGLQDANVNPAFQQAQAQLQKKQVDISAYGGAYGELYKNLELARYQYLKDIPLLQIIDEANYPMTRIKSGKLTTGIVYGILFGLVCAVVLLVRRKWRQVFQPVKN